LPLAAFEAGIGLYRERGLGLVWPNPKMLLKKHPGDGLVEPVADERLAELLKERPAAPVGSATREEADEEARLVAAVRTRARDIRNAKEISTLAEKLVNHINRFGGALPAPTQWSRVAKEAARAPSLSKLREALFHKPAENAPADERPGMCVGPANADWKAIREPFEKLFDRPVEEGPDHIVFRAALERAARQIAREGRRR
jgi:hypothetical protein